MNTSVRAPPDEVVIAFRLFIMVMGLAASECAQAHGIAGNRFFPGTMAFDDPAVADEFLVEPLSLSHPPDTDSTFNVIDNAVAWSFQRLLTPDLLIGINGGRIHRGDNGFPTQTGFDQSSITLKGLVYRNDLHETLISASLTWAIGSSGAQAVGANKPNSLIPSITFGKGFGDLPDELGWLRRQSFAHQSGGSSILTTPVQCTWSRRRIRCRAAHLARLDDGLNARALG